MRALLFTIATAFLITTSSFEKPHKKIVAATLFSSCTNCIASQTITLSGTGYPNNKGIGMTAVRSDGYQIGWNAGYAVGGVISSDIKLISPGEYTVSSYYVQGHKQITLATTVFTIQ